MWHIYVIFRAKKTLRMKTIIFGAIVHHKFLVSKFSTCQSLNATIHAQNLKMSLVRIASTNNWISKVG
jgi:hypothetical protein